MTKCVHRGPEQHPDIHQGGSVRGHHVRSTLAGNVDLDGEVSVVTAGVGARSGAREGQHAAGNLDRAAAGLLQCRFCFWTIRRRTIPVSIGGFSKLRGLQEIRSAAQAETCGSDRRQKPGFAATSIGATAAPDYPWPVPGRSRWKGVVRRHDPDRRKCSPGAHPGTKEA